MTITSLELNTWKLNHAPWAKTSHVEQDLRLARGVEAIFADPVLGACLAMRGGTVLHKGHLPPASRYSEDIDLVRIAPIETKDLETRLRQVLRPILGTPSNSVLDFVQLTIRNATKPSQISRTTFTFVPTGLQRKETIKVEVNLNEDKPFYSLVPVAIHTMDAACAIYQANAMSYDIDEMLGTKMRALMQRYQGRDLFDLWHAWDLSQQGQSAFPVNPRRAMAAFEHYLHAEGNSLGQAEAHEELNKRLADKGFCDDMLTLQRPGMAAFNPVAAGTTVRGFYFPHLSKP
jgi:predicted nucleotidyltransferase component of viral defense system